MKSISIKKNYIYSVFYQLLCLVVPFITTPYVSRILGAEGIGIYSYTFSIVTYFTLFAALGTTTYGTREIAQHRDNAQVASKLFWEITIMKAITTGICLLFWAGVIVLSEQYRYYYIALIPVLLGTLFDIAWFFNGFEQIKYNVLRNSLCKIAGIFLLLLLVRKKSDLIVYVLINSMITLVGNLSMWTYLPRFLTHVDFRKLSLRRHFRETLVYFIPTIATSIYTVLDKSLIGIITENAYENGYYEQATKIINIIKALVFTSVNTVMEARIAYLFAEKNFAEIHRRIEKSLNLILVLGFGCTFGLIGVAKTFVPVFFGDGYTPVIELLYIFSPIILIIGVSNCLGAQYYTPSGQRMKSAKIIILGSCVNLGLNLMLIPRLESNGAAIASIIAETVITVLYVANSKRYMTVAILWKNSWKRLVAGMGMLIIIREIGIINNINSVILMLQIFFGGLTYGLILIILKDNMIRELFGILKNIFNRKRI